MKRLIVGCVLIGLFALSPGQGEGTARVLRERGLAELGAHRMLTELCTSVGARISGSPQAEKAVQWGKRTMEGLGLQKVHLMPCLVPHWVRGREDLEMTSPSKTKLSCCALGGSIGTPKNGLEGEVIEVHSLQEASELGERAKGKILFFNRPMDPSLLNTFAAYGGAVDQRGGGAIAAAKVGAIGALVRSMTLDADDEPHTGVMRYQEGVPQVPGAAVSIVAANKLSEALKHGKVRVRLDLGCKTMPDVPSSNVIGEITGSEHPEEVIVIGGHLDSWDKGQGAHDDGAGVTQCLEAMRIIKELGWQPKRTIRVVLFMNEESEGRGAKAYADYAAQAAGEKHIAAIESDSGGFAPLGFSTSLADTSGISKWLPALAGLGADRLQAGGGGGADVGPLGRLGAILFGLEPESQRYFDYHHSHKDTIDKVNPRELELGALSVALLAWLISEDGLPQK